MIFSVLYPVVALSFAIAATASPPNYRPYYEPTYSPSYRRPSYHTKRTAADNTVKVFSEDHHCLILPREPHTNIGDSEHPGGMQSFCTTSGRDNDSQGLLPQEFWSNLEYRWDRGPRGGKWAQLTGCIQPETVDRLNSDDGGGQYDSSGGAGGRGNPRGSVCAGYNHYVEIMEPSEKRACIRCCEDYDDCPLDKDTAGCPAIIEGNYFDCA